MNDDSALSASLTSGFEHLMESPGDAATVDLADKTIAFDANALLEFYRRHFSSTQNIMLDLKRVASQLFLPAQAQKEFWLNRDGVLQHVRGADSSRDLSDAEKAVKRAIEAAARWDIDSDEQRRLKKLVAETFQEVRKSVGGKSAANRATQALVDPKSDVVIATLDRLFSGRTGLPFGPDHYAALCEEADARFARREPPGYMDAGKPNGGYGDFLLWEQLIERAKIDRRPMVLVTNDKKEDWWRLLEGRTPMNARFELVAEMRLRAGVDFYTLTFEDFLTSLSADPTSGINESAVDDTGINGELEASPDVKDSWNVDELGAVVSRLAELGYHKHAMVILAAAKVPDGVLQRAAVLSILELPADSKLTGFTRAIRNVQRELTDDGVLRTGLSWALVAQYDGPGKAQRFAVPAELATLLANPDLS